MLFLGVKPKVSHKWFRKTICSVDIIYTKRYGQIRFHEIIRTFFKLFFVFPTLDCTLQMI